MISTARTKLEHDHVVRLKVSWTTYNTLIQELDEHRHARFTYDGETLEIMSPGSKHELIANLLADMIAFATVEWSINLTNFGSTTFQTEPRAGFEADKSYYLDAKRRIRNVEQVDLLIDPPPDLVVEVDITSSSSMRLETYAALGVSEVWRFKNDALAFLALRDGEYFPIEVSRILHGLPAIEVARRIQSAIEAKGDILAIRTEWSHWLRENRRLHEIAQPEA